MVRGLIKIDQKNQYTIILTPADEEEYDQAILNHKSKIINFKKLVVPITHYTIAEQTKFLKVLNDGKFDLVHFTNFNHPICYKRKFIITVHDLTLMLYPFGRQKSALKQIAFKKVMSHAVHKAQKIIAISRATKKDLVQHLHANPAKIEVIYEGIDSAYRPNSKFKIQNSKLWKDYKISKPYLLFVSQWRPHKGLPELIRAFEILKQDKKNKDLQLVVTGKPDPGFPEIPRTIHNSQFSNDIIASGFVPDQDLPLIYANADVFVFPSHYEGFGLPPLEAMACGVPVVASKASCMPEILGDGAEYFNSNKPEEIAETIDLVLTEDRRRKTMIKKGFEQVKKYSWAKMAQETLDIYKKVLFT